MPHVTSIDASLQPGGVGGLVVTSAVGGPNSARVMIDSTRLIPPASGSARNPILFGVSEGLARLLPLPEDDLAALGPIPAIDPGTGPAPASVDPLGEPSAEAGQPR